MPLTLSRKQDWCGLDQIRGQPLIQLLAVAALGEGARLDTEGDGADRPHEQPLAGAGTRNLGCPNQKARGEPQTGPTDSGQEADQECAFVHAGRMIKVHDLDAELRVMTPRRIGKRKGPERLPQQPQGGFCVGARRVLRDLQVRHACAPEAGVLIVAFGSPNRTVRRKHRRRADAGERPQIPFPIHLEVHAGHTIRQGDRHEFLAHLLDRTGKTMCLAHNAAGSHPTCDGGTAVAARYDLYRTIPIEEVSDRARRSRSSRAVAGRSPPSTTRSGFSLAGDDERAQSSTGASDISIRQSDLACRSSWVLVWWVILAGWRFSRVIFVNSRAWMCRSFSWRPLLPVPGPIVGRASCPNRTARIRRG